MVSTRSACSQPVPAPVHSPTWPAWHKPSDPCWAAAKSLSFPSPHTHAHAHTHTCACGPWVRVATPTKPPNTGHTRALLHNRPNSCTSTLRNPRTNTLCNPCTNTLRNPCTNTLRDLCETCRVDGGDLLLDVQDSVLGANLDRQHVARGHLDVPVQWNSTPLSNEVSFGKCSVQLNVNGGRSVPFGGRAPHARCTRMGVRVVNLTKPFHSKTTPTQL